MSTVGPLGGVNVSAAGVPLAQTKGSDVDRASQDVGAQHRNTVFEKKAEAAAGIGEADGQNHETNERDADGRRPWEFHAKQQRPGDDPSQLPPQSRDTSGESGNLLDLTG
jgi:hypothetical protein